MGQRTSPSGPSFRRPTVSTRNPLSRRLIAALLLVLLNACYSWRPTTVSPQRLIPEDQPLSVRVTLMNGETVTVESPTVRNDSIVGVTDLPAVGVATRDVRLLEVRRFDVGETLGLVVGTAVGAWVVALGYYILICDGCLR